MSGNAFPVKRVAMTVVAFAVVAVAGVATVSIIPAIAAGASSNTAKSLATTSASSANGAQSAARAIATRRIALTLFRTSVEQTGLSRTTVLKDLLNGETLAQIDGSKAQAVENAVTTKIAARLTKAVSKGRITQAQATAFNAAATAGITKLMNLNLSTYIRVRFGGFPQIPATAPSSTPSPAAATGLSTSL
jgi:hypothetical protein